MTDPAQDTNLKQRRPWGNLGDVMRRFPIRNRILAIGVLNTAVILLLIVLIFDGAKVLNGAWSELLQVRRSDRILVSVETEAGRLQSLIHRYFTQPNPEVLVEIEQRRKTLTDVLNSDANVHPEFSAETRDLAHIIERLVAAFDELRTVRASISTVYEDEVLKTIREISGLYAIVEGTIKSADSLVRPSLSKSRESFSTALLAVNAYYLSVSSRSAQDAFKALDTVESTLPVMLDLSDSELQRGALTAMRARVIHLRVSLLKLAAAFEKQGTLLRDSVDRSQADMTSAAALLSAGVRAREAEVQGRLDTALNEIYRKIAVMAVASLVLIVLFGMGIARSISRPLSQLMASVDSIVRGRLDERVRGLGARDEIGAMARAIEVFRDNAKAKLKAEEELRTAKVYAENAYAELRDTQRSLIEAEKLAALGGLVAGVAHEVNNPVGISLTVASSLSRRCEQFAAEIERGELRKSRLVEFVSGSREAAGQLVSNLHRAGDLIQSFKQVAVDRSHAERRSFDLAEATEQIMASLRPGLNKSRLGLSVHCDPGIIFDSYPGAYGQVLTNLFMNAVTHAFKTKTTGNIRIDVKDLKTGHVQIEFSDDGDGMSDEVRRRAFDPFFTTLRGKGGTGLGLHIVYNIVTRQLGGQISLTTQAGQGSIFRIMLPVVAPMESAADEADIENRTQRRG